MITHFDRDHRGNFEKIYKFVQPKELWVPWVDHSRFGIWLKNQKSQAISELRQKPRAICSKDFCLEGWIVTTKTEFKNVENNDSIVLMLTKRGTTKVLAVLTGDLMKTGEKKLINLIRSQGYRVRGAIYKAGHHGSKTSSTENLIDLISPKLVLITAGRNNQYGFPHTEVLQNFRRRAASIIRVDALGNVKLEFDF